MNKSANIWHCNDCHKIGFYYGMADEEITKVHQTECSAKDESGLCEPVPTETVGLPPGGMHVNWSSKKIAD